MSFNSVDFLVFFPFVALAYYLIPGRFRWVLLLAASYYFYAAWQPAYALLIGAATLVSYAAALLTTRTSRRATRLRPIALAAAVILGMLAVFKYYGFFMGALAELLDPLGIQLTARRFDLLLPRLKAKGFAGPVTIEREISGPQQAKDIKKSMEQLDPFL